jgi:hypothetical protein
LKEGFLQSLKSSSLTPAALLSSPAQFIRLIIALVRLAMAVEG